MTLHHLSVRIDNTKDHYYPPRDSISIFLRILIEKCNYLIKKLIMCEEISRKTKKEHCHIHIEYEVPLGERVFKSISQKIIRELETNKGEVATLPPRQFSIATKEVKDKDRFMRYPLKDQEDLSNTLQIGYDENDLEIMRALAFEERQVKIASWEKTNKKKEEENSTFEELCDYLTYSCPIDISHLEYQFERYILERLGCKIVCFYRVYKKSKLPFNLDRILFRYLLYKGIATDLEIFQMMSRT